jgi:hypothetical protein
MASSVVKKTDVKETDVKDTDVKDTDAKDTDVKDTVVGTVVKDTIVKIRRHLPWTDNNRTCADWEPITRIVSWLVIHISHLLYHCRREISVSRILLYKG